VASTRNKVFAKVRRFIRENSMIEGSRGVVVAVSGGPDSIALLDMLVRSRDMKTRRQPSGSFELHIVHLDHRLRDESRLDAYFVRDRARSLGLPCTIEAVDVAAMARKSKKGIEEAARELRYELLLRVAEERKLDRIATGHTMNDQAETLLMRLVRGSGAKGLAAMRAVAPAHEFGQRMSEASIANGEGTTRVVSSSRSKSCLLIRPLLCLTREEVEQYCGDRDLQFRVDPSNEARDYLRNRVRHDVLPVLSQLNPQAIRSIARAAGILAGEQDALEARARLLVDRATVSVEKRGGEARYAAKPFQEQPDALRRRMIIEAIDRCAFPRTDSAGQVTALHVNAVGRLLTDGASGKRVEIGRGLQAWREFDQLVFVKTKPGRRAALPETELASEPGSAQFGDLVLTLERKINAASKEHLMAETKTHNESTGRNWMMALLDSERLSDRLIIRTRRRGEEAHVVGQRKTKKLKNLMIDHKIPSSRRASWPIITTPDGRYVWSPGLPPQIDFAATDETRLFAVLTAVEKN
jgi:tRNA(Ile)-lysidine synthetase-like protein